jgi:signal transduction histidine kinase
MLTEVATMSEASIFCANPFAKARVSPDWTRDNPDRVKLESLTREIKELITLYNVGAAVGSSLNLKEVLWTLYQESGRLVDTSNFALAIYDDRTDTLAFPLVFDRGERVKPFSVKRSNDQGLTSHVLTTQAPLLIRDLLETEGGVEIGLIHPDQPIRSWLGVPIRNPGPTNGRAQGAIVIWSYQPNAFTDRDLWLLSAIGAQAAVAIRNARLFQASQRRATEMAMKNAAIADENARLHESVLAERDRIIEAEEQVRKELASDLHDGPTQLISGIMMQLDFCQKALEKDPSLLPEQFTIMRELAEQAIHQMRTMLFELRPLVLETQGLEAGLQVFLERRQKEIATTKLTLNVETCQPSGVISRHEAKVEAAIFAIVQEAVNNALRHAEADHIVVHLKETPTVMRTIVVDDGKGFDVNEMMAGYEQRSSLGIVNIRERADLIGGELAITSGPGQGTRITLSVPKAKEERIKKRGATRRLSLPLNMLPEG